MKIKFRSWNKRDKVMEFPDHIANGIDGGKYQIMQFTGLKDKQGKEIYEGDILSYKSQTVKKEPYEVRYEVRWGLFDNGEDYDDRQNGCGVYLVEIVNLLKGIKRFPEDKGRVWNYDSPHGLEVMEVIGNIYESKSSEFLKES